MVVVESGPDACQRRKVLKAGAVARLVVAAMGRATLSKLYVIKLTLEMN